MSAPRPARTTPRSLDLKSAVASLQSQPTAPPPSGARGSFEFPGGYYSPDERVAYGDTEVATLELDDSPDTTAGTDRYQAHVLIGEIGSEKHGRFRCSDALVRADTLDVICRSTSLGTVTMRGSFNGVLRPGWDSTMDYSDISQHALANVTITVERAGQVLVSKRVALIYWEGE